MRYVSILGSTGSIGVNTLKVLEKREDLALYALGAHTNRKLLLEQIQKYQPECVAVFDPKVAKALKKDVNIPVLEGMEGMVAIAQEPCVSDVVVAMSTVEALEPTVAALKENKTVALATKEVIVAAGHLIKEVLKTSGTLIPVDSEHSALFQCLEHHDRSSIAKLILTSSGGPFFHLDQTALEKVTLEQALHHPVWKMGTKITIDSSTMMNKALEIIEARWLFDTTDIDVLIHPSGVVHGLIEFIDGQVLSLASVPDMRFAINYALSYPKRVNINLPSLDWTKQPLEFYPPDLEKFPSLKLAKQALREKSSFSCVLNSGNQALVTHFLNREIPWYQITQTLHHLLDRHSSYEVADIDQIISLDQETKRKVTELI